MVAVGWPRREIFFLLLNDGLGCGFYCYGFVLLDKEKGKKNLVADKGKKKNVGSISFFLFFLFFFIFSSFLKEKKKKGKEKESDKGFSYKGQA